jgi:hypothetical protein
VSRDVRDAGAAVTTGAVASAGNVLERPGAAANGLDDVAIGDSSADADNHRIGSSQLRGGTYRF